jgi:hypothetical protein
LCRYEYTPKKIPLFVEKDPKSKEVVPLPLPKIVKECCQHFRIILAMLWIRNDLVRILFVRIFPDPPPEAWI